MFDQYTYADKSIDVWIPVRLVDDVDKVSGETAKTNAHITVKFCIEGEPCLTLYEPSVNDFIEIGDVKIESSSSACGGVFEEDGNYWLRIGAAEFTAYGKYFIQVQCDGCHTYKAIIQVGFDLTKAAWANTTNLFSAIRRTHVLASGTKTTQDASANNPTIIHRDEADAIDAITEETTEGGNVTTITPTS